MIRDIKAMYEASPSGATATQYEQALLQIDRERQAMVCGNSHGSCLIVISGRPCKKIFHISSY